MKKAVSLLLAILLIACLAACGGNLSTNTGSPANEAGANTDITDSSADETLSDTDADQSTEALITNINEQTSEPANTDAKNDEPTGSNVLIVVFSATGTTKGVAEKIASIESADLYEIIPAEPYSDADLNWNDSNSRTTKEQNDPKVRPEIASETIDLSDYSRIYVGYPIWWGEEPRIMDTFVESYDFGDATVIPFCTSGGSGIGRSERNLAENAGNGNWLDGARFSGSVSEEELSIWINDLK